MSKPASDSEPIDEDRSLELSGEQLSALVDAAMDRIEHLLSVPAFFSIPYLEASSKFDPIRELPRYKRIVRKYSGKSDS